MAEYIDREALDEFLKKEIQQCEDEIQESNGEDDRYEQAVESRMIGLLDARRYVSNAPAADVVEVRHGRWLPQKLCGENIFDCSECKTIGSPQWKWCPVCGAKMDGKE